jgi:hypothetical protein
MLRKFAAAVGCSVKSLFQGGRMAELPSPPTCDICGRPANCYVCDMSDGTARNQAFCIDHVPREMLDAMPKTRAEEVALLRDKLASLDQSEMAPDVKAKVRAGLEQIIDEVEAGRRHLGDLI